jgi:hypothetical protein
MEVLVLEQLLTNFLHSGPMVSFEQVFVAKFPP